MKSREQGSPWLVLDNDLGMDVKVSSKYNKIPTLISTINSKKDIGYNTKKIWTEYQLINRLLYRSKNQHKASLSFQHLKEVKKLGERVGKLENWLKENFVESGEKMFEFVGFLSSLRLLLDKTLEACRKTFYFYSQYLDQGLFVTLALVAVGSVSSLHNELMQWNKYVKILYDSQVNKLTIEFGREKVEKWCKENNLQEKIGYIKEESKELKPPQTNNNVNKNPNLPLKHSSQSKSKKNFIKKSKSNQSIGNEIDDIFNLL